ncbi:hypothetical protein IC608_12290 [Devosia sp. PTR5]|jgi:hypothetical protein|uniref:Uncharacterized protein n=1 Tax=Devosia oryzisoli TaxID=2774138 RepID=A0A927FX37_9HYPH|nr:hypothetical protein [Devosia oryzisoli]MBD8066249.1 hypothetical protein [Devosia oryzisoli]
MTTKTTTRRITFRHRFALANMSETHAPGTFDLVIEKIPLDVSWEAHRTSCQLMLIDGGTTSAIAVTMTDVEAALLADSQHDVSTGFS